MTLLNFPYWGRGGAQGVHPVFLLKILAVTQLLWGTAFTSAAGHNSDQCKNKMKSTFCLRKIMRRKGKLRPFFPL